MYTGQLTDQHQKLWTLIHAMENSSPADAAGTARTVAQLSGILSIHLAAEDKYLYPSLKNSPDDKIRAVAIRYEKEMGHLAATYTAYRNQYRTASRIEADPAGFTRETRRILQALSERLTREDRELYPLLTD